MSWPVVQPTDAPVDSEQAELDWRRPHPITIVVEIGRAIRSVIVALVVVSGGFLEGATFLEAVLIGSPLVAALLRWYTTRYALDAESIHHHHGLLWRTKQVLPRANVQNVSTTAGLLARFASVVELQISEASSSGDIKIRYVTQEEAERLTVLLRSSFGAGAPVGPEPVPDGEHPAPTPVGAAVATEPLIEPAIGQLIRAELTSVGLAVSVLGSLVAAIAIAVTLAGIGDVDWPEPLERLGPLTILLVAAVPILMALLGTVGRIMVLGGFRLTAEPDRLRIQVGLLTEARVAARRERIQQLRVERELPHRLLAMERVGYETADIEVAGTAGTRYLAPVASAGSWAPLAVEVFGALQLTEEDLEPVSPLTQRRAFVRFLVAAPLWAVLIPVSPVLAAVGAAAWLGLGWWYSRARFRVLGWARSADQLLVRKGVVAGQLNLVQLDKVQNVRLAASFFQRRLGLATLSVSTAGRGSGGLVSIPDLPAEVAGSLMTDLAFRAAVTPIAETL